MKTLKMALSVMTALCVGCVPAASAQAEPTSSDQPEWHFGFGKQEILPDPSSSQPLYIAGYNQGLEISGVLDYCQARAVWLDVGGEGILIIGIDCVALDSGTVARIREGLSHLPNCAAINVFATHTHAGPDTLGLWGPIGVNGKNDAYMSALVAAAIKAGEEAAAAPKAGKLYFAHVETQDMYRDSRLPHVFDPNLYQLRFVPDDGSAGIRLYSYGAHAESLRGNNSLLSRDFFGQLCDRVTEATGDHTICASGPAGGLIMTKAFVENTTLDAQKNLQITSDKMVEYALSITPDMERELKPVIKWNRQVFTIPLDNPVFVTYKFLGILGTRAVPADSATGYGVETELSVLMLDDLAIAMIPGEPFPELVLGGEYGDTNPQGVNPRPLMEIARENGISDMFLITLCNDEVGYIVAPSDFLLNEEAPYLQRTIDYKNEDHYEETNSVGPECARKIAAAFETAVKNLK